MNVPSDLLYTIEHEWVKIEGDTATIGITDYAQSELGDIVMIELEGPGLKVAIGDSLGTLEAVKTVSDIYAPLSGEVIEVNADLEMEPEKINEDPYGSGWIVKIRMSAAAEKEQLISAQDYAGQIE